MMRYHSQPEVQFMQLDSPVCEIDEKEHKSKAVEILHFLTLQTREPSINVPALAELAAMGGNDSKVKLLALCKKIYLLPLVPTDRGISSVIAEPIRRSSNFQGTVWALKKAGELKLDAVSPIILSLFKRRLQPAPSTLLIALETARQLGGEIYIEILKLAVKSYSREVREKAFEYISSVHFIGKEDIMINHLKWLNTQERRRSELHGLIDVTTNIFNNSDVENTLMALVKSEQYPSEYIGLLIDIFKILSELHKPSDVKHKQQKEIRMRYKDLIYRLFGGTRPLGFVKRVETAGFDYDWALSFNEEITFGIVVRILSHSVHRTSEISHLFCSYLHGQLNGKRVQQCKYVINGLMILRDPSSVEILASCLQQQHLYWDAFNALITVGSEACENVIISQLRTSIESESDWPYRVIAGRCMEYFTIIRDAKVYDLIRAVLKREKNGNSYIGLLATRALLVNGRESGKKSYFEKNVYPHVQDKIGLLEVLAAVGYTHKIEEKILNLWKIYRESTILEFKIIIIKVALQLKPDLGLQILSTVSMSDLSHAEFKEVAQLLGNFKDSERAQNILLYWLNNDNVTLDLKSMALVSLLNVNSILAIEYIRDRINSPRFRSLLTESSICRIAEIARDN